MILVPYTPEAIQKIWHAALGDFIIPKTNDPYTEFMNMIGSADQHIHETKLAVIQESELVQLTNAFTGTISVQRVGEGKLVCLLTHTKAGWLSYDRSRASGPNTQSSVHRQF
jgi:hypothetical protein